MKKETFEQKIRTFLLHINGGLGKVIMATAVIRSYKLAHPEDQIVIVSGYPEVFINNPDVHRNFNFNTPYLWQDYYSKPETKIYAHDPYFNPQWIKNKKIHLIDVWCGELGIPSVQKTPLLYFSSAEVDDLQAMVKTDKPLIVVQSTGGSKPELRSWTRNPPQNELEEYLLNFKDSHYVLHLALPQTPKLVNCHQRIETLNRRQAMCLIHYAAGFIGIDSFGQHARAANTNSGPTTIFFPLAESVQKLSYEKTNWLNLIPTEEVQQMIESHQDYFATVFKFNIEDASENCPVPAGTKWFNLDLGLVSGNS